jgi:20S proteasome alpha/beta subunit
VTTVSGVTSAALAATVFSDIASLAITTSQTSANIITTNQQNFAFQVSVSAISGLNAAMDVIVQETFDGTTYYDIYHFPRITAIGQYRSPQIRATGSGIRYIRTVSGTTPSITNAVSRPVRQTSSDLFRNFFDRTLDPNTLNSTTATFFMDGCDQMQLAITMNAGGTAPIIKMQGSEDSLNWYDLPSMSITAAVGAVTQIMSSATSMPRFVRSIVATAGVGSSLAAVDMKGRGV